MTKSATRTAVHPTFDVEGDVVLITGASLGIGRALANGFAAAGARVVVNYREHGEDAEAVVNAIRRRGGEAIAVPADVTVAPQVEGMVDEVVERFGPVDTLVANAGINRRGPTLEQDPGQWQRVLAVDLEGVFNCARAVVARSMAGNGGGRIVTLGSISAFTVQREVQQSAYHAAKGAVVMLTRSLALEWVELGVRANCLCPGYIRTPLLAEDFAPGTPAFESAIAATPMGRMGEPEELVGPAIFLASAASSYLTGQTLIVDGGYMSW